MTNQLRRLVEAQVDLGYLANNFYLPRRLVEGQGVHPHLKIDGRQCVSFVTLDYLGLACHPQVIDAAIRATQIYGVGALPSRLATGTLDIHEELERVLAEFMKAEDSLVFTSGTLTNLGTIPAIMSSQLSLVRDTGRPGHSRAIFVDELSHASIIDSLRLCKTGGVCLYSYKHADMDDLRRLLDIQRQELTLIITDGMFSMDGDIAPLPEITRLAAKYESVVMVDDAHSIGVIGPNGRGSCELCEVENEVHVRMGTTSKALGVMGGFIVGEKWFIEYLRYAARTNMFSMGIPASCAAAIIRAIKILQEEPWRREQVLKNANYLRSKLQQRGFNTLGSMNHIIPIFIGDDEKARKLAMSLYQEGILVTPMYYPVVPKGQARIRPLVTCLHTESDMDYFIETLSKVLN